MGSNVASLTETETLVRVLILGSGFIATLKIIF